MSFIGRGFFFIILFGMLPAHSQFEYSDKVKTILTNQCYRCHGLQEPNGTIHNEGNIGSILDVNSLISKGLLSPNKPELSEIIRVVKSGVMPYALPRLKDAQIKDLSDWVASLPAPASTGGAADPKTLPKVYDQADLPLRAPVTSVLQHHGGPTRDGLYVEPSFSRSAVVGMTKVQSFASGVEGAVYANPIFVDHTLTGDRDLLIVVTEKNQVAALDANSGAVIWKRQVGVSVPLKSLPCGNIDPLGVTGTPVVDSVSRTLFFDSMQAPKALNGGGKVVLRHVVHRLNLKTGESVQGWPVDVQGELKKQGLIFNSEFQNQRGALALTHNTVFVPYGGHYGDCGDYHGWIVGIPLDRTQKILSYQTKGKEGGIWAPGGISYDDNFLYFATGNTDGAKAWSGGEAYFRLPASDLKFSGKPDSFFSPSNWQALDEGDVDVGGVCPLVVDMPQGRHKQILVGFGKDGKIYAVDRNRPGGVGGALISQVVSGSSIITAPAYYTAASGTYIAFRGHPIKCPGGADGDIGAVRLTPTPILKVETAWCGKQNGTGSPIVTTTDGHSDPIVWSLGAEGDGLLHAFDGETGAPIVPTVPWPKMEGLGHFISPIVAQGRIWVVHEGQVDVFATDALRLPANTRKPASIKKKAPAKSTGASQ